MLVVLPIGLPNSLMGVAMDKSGLKPVYFRDEQSTHTQELYKIVPVFSNL
jgi:hypothetical protein